MGKKRFFLFIVFLISLFILNSKITLSQTQGIDVAITIVDESFQETGNAGNAGGSTGGGSGGGGTKIKKEEIPEKCRERWICTNWNECINGTQTMECYDYNNCGTFELRPPLERPCEIEQIERPKELPKEEKPSSNINNMVGIKERLFSNTNNMVGILLLLIITIILIKQLKNPKRKKITHQKG